MLEITIGAALLAKAMNTAVASVKRGQKHEIVVNFALVVLQIARLVLAIVS